MAQMTSAPAKIILFGEHAVVYGQPALAVPVTQLKATATLTPSAHFQIIAADLNRTLTLHGDDARLDDALSHMAKNTLNFLGAAIPPVSIAITSTIPPASGLGSGAAVSAALGRALALATEKTLCDDDLNALVYGVEKIHHGTPSGIDNTVIVYERPVYFVRDMPIETFSLKQPITLLIADTGQTALTKYAVGDVRTLYETKSETTLPIIEAIGEIVNQAQAAMMHGDLITLGQLATRNHQLLQQLTVSSPELDALVSAAESAGALGAKLSGGGRGGNMIAFVTPETADQVQAALFSVGAANVIKTTIQ